MVISNFARSNFVDSTFTDQSSVVKFIESNWGLNPMGNGVADTGAGSIDGMFNFAAPANHPLPLNPATGEPGFGR